VVCGNEKDVYYETERACCGVLLVVRMTKDTEISYPLKIYNFPLAVALQLGGFDSAGYRGPRESLD